MDNITITTPSLFVTKDLIYLQGDCITNSKNTNPTRCIKLNIVLERIIKAFYEDYPIDRVLLHLQNNYLGDAGVEELVIFFKFHSKIAKRTFELDLTHNRLTDACFENIEKILTLCPQIKIDISVNGFTSKYEKSKLYGKVRCQAY